MNHVQNTTDHEMMHLFGYFQEESFYDYAWCGNHNNELLKGCPHPDGVPPNNGSEDQWCMMGANIPSEHNQTVAMRTGGVNRLDCSLLGRSLAFNPPPCNPGEGFWGHRPGVRTQDDPQ